MINETEIKEHLLALIKEYQSYAKAPISNFKVGAAIRTNDDKYFPGFNIEESAFTRTGHAEQVALFNCITAYKSQRPAITHIAVLGGIPCGHCRQLLNDFITDDTIIYAFDQDGKEIFVGTMPDLLPHAFSVDLTSH